MSGPTLVIGLPAAVPCAALRRLRELLLGLSAGSNR